MKNDKGNVVKVTFGDTSGLRVKLDDKQARKNFASRHNCEQQKDKTSLHIGVAIYQGMQNNLD